MPAAYKNFQQITGYWDLSRNFNKCNCNSNIQEKGSKSNCENNRPISVLCVVSKIFEALITDKLTTYLNKTKLFNEAQHGFRKNHSTLSALTSLTSIIYKTVDKGLYTGVLFVDFKSAFDMVDYEILLKNHYLLESQDSYRTSLGPT